jgi:hypothetical protein
MALVSALNLLDLVLKVLNVLLVDTNFLFAKGSQALKLVKLDVCFLFFFIIVEHVPKPTLPWTLH